MPNNALAHGPFPLPERAVKCVDRKHLTKLLEGLRDGLTTVDEAMDALRNFPILELKDARLDTHRVLRRGFPETILAQGKTTSQLVTIVERMAETGNNVLITRANPEQTAALRAVLGDEAVREFPPSTTLVVGNHPIEPQGRGLIAVLSAGTADLPVAVEARVTAEQMGNEVIALNDVGVAGLHRLLGELDTLRKASVIVVAAGMDGALPSVVAGLSDVPVIALPTSTGYGAAFGGVAALLTMLNSCAAGVSVVNIDNGFGAGYAAALMNRREEGVQHAPAKSANGESS